MILPESCSHASSSWRGQGFEEREIKIKKAIDMYRGGI